MGHPKLNLINLMAFNLKHALTYFDYFTFLYLILPLPIKNQYSTFFLISHFSFSCILNPCNIKYITLRITLIFNPLLYVDNTKMRFLVFSRNVGPKSFLVKEQKSTLISLFQIHKLKYWEISRNIV